MQLFKDLLRWITMGELEQVLVHFGADSSPYTCFFEIMGKRFKVYAYPLQQQQTTYICTTMKSHKSLVEIQVQKLERIIAT